MEFTQLRADLPELILGFFFGNVLWFSRQWLWQQWVKKSHKHIADANRVEEERTREEIRKLREQIGYLSVASMEKLEATLAPTDKTEIKAIVDNKEEVLG